MDLSYGHSLDYDDTGFYLNKSIFFLFVFNNNTRKTGVQGGLRPLWGLGEPPKVVGDAPLLGGLLSKLHYKAIGVLGTVFGQL